MIKDFFILAFRNLKKRKLRSFLTALGIIISIATLFVLVSLSLGLQGAIKEQFRLLGTDKFFILPKDQYGGAISQAIVTFSEEDVKVIEKVQGVKGLSYFSSANAEVEFNKEKRFAVVTSVPLDRMDVFKEISSYKIEEGKEFKEGDSGWLIIGSQYKHNNFFSKPVKVKDRLLINGAEFKVKAILQSLGSSMDDRIIYMPRDDFVSLFNKDSINQIIVQINPNENINEVAKRVEKKLRTFRGVTEDTQDFSVLTPEELLSSFSIILNIITAFLGGIAALSLLVGGVVISNTMFTSVLERTKEIGIMKSIGAQNKDILLIFLIESGLLGLFGGLIGVLLGFLVTTILVEIINTQLNSSLIQAAYPIYLIIGSLLFAFFIGLLSGIIPAYKASKTKISETLRYE